MTYIKMTKEKKKKSFVRENAYQITERTTFEIREIEIQGWKRRRWRKKKRKMETKMGNDIENDMGRKGKDWEEWSMVRLGKNKWRGKEREQMTWNVRNFEIFLKEKF